MDRDSFGSVDPDLHHWYIECCELAGSLVDEAPGWAGGDDGEEGYNRPPLDDIPPQGGVLRGREQSGTGGPSGSGKRTVDSGQWTVDIGQLTVDSGQWTVDRGQWTVDSGQWTVDSGQWTEDSGQWTVNSGQRTKDSGQGIGDSVESGQWTVDSGQCSVGLEKGKGEVDS